MMDNPYCPGAYGVPHEIDGWHVEEIISSDNQPLGWSSVCVHCKQDIYQEPHDQRWFGHAYVIQETP